MCLGHEASEDSYLEDYKRELSKAGFRPYNFLFTAKELEKLYEVFATCMGIMYQPGPDMVAVGAGLFDAVAKVAPDQLFLRPVDHLEFMTLVEAGQAGIRACSTCQRRSAHMQQCARCKRANYCSKECQRSAWSFHKLACEPQ